MPSLSSIMNGWRAQPLTYAHTGSPGRSHIHTHTHKVKSTPTSILTQGETGAAQSLSLSETGGQNTLTLTPSVWRAKHTHSHSLKKEGKAHSLSDKASHSLIHRMEATLTFTRRQTRRVEGTCTHKHLVSLPDSHSGGQRTHSHALTENGKTTHSHVPTRGKSLLTLTLSLGFTP